MSDKPDWRTELAELGRYIKKHFWPTGEYAQVVRGNPFDVTDVEDISTKPRFAMRGVCVPEFTRRAGRARDAMRRAGLVPPLSDCGETTDPRHRAYLEVDAFVTWLEGIPASRRRQDITDTDDPAEIVALFREAIETPDPTAASATSRVASGARAGSGLRPAALKAYHSFGLACDAMNPPPETDREAYDWLTKHPDKLEEYELPAFDTWRRYVRSGRNYYGQQKYTPRADRVGRSIVRPSQIEPRDRTEADFD